MIYVFVNDETGELVDVAFDSKNAPKIGDVIDHDGVKLRRLASNHIDTAGIRRKTHKYPYESSQLPRTPDNKKQVIHSMSHEREYGARHELEKH